MAKAVSFVREQLKGVRGVQITPNLIGSIRFEQGLVSHLATICKTNESIAVRLFDASDKALVARLTKTILLAGFNAYQFSKDTIVVSISNDKEGVVRYISQCKENARIAIRNVRKAIKKRGDVDDKELQRLTNRYIKEIDDL